MTTSAKVIVSKNQVNKDKSYIVVDTQTHGKELCFYTSIMKGQHLITCFHEYEGCQFLVKEDLDEECCLNEYGAKKVFIAELA